MIIIISIVLFSCDQKSNTIKKDNTTPVKNNKFDKFLKKFKTITIDTFYVYSNYDDKRFEGIRIDNIEGKLFPKEIIEQNFINHQLDIFACYKFLIDSNRIGLIARTPSEYSPTSIKLFIYDTFTNSIINYIEIAEIWGDAGDSMEKQSWLFLKNNNLKVLLEKNESTDHRASAEDENDTLIERWNYLYLIELKKSNFDTVKTNEKYIRNKYYKLLKKASY